MKDFFRKVSIYFIYCFIFIFIFGGVYLYFINNNLSLVSFSNDIDNCFMTLVSFRKLLIDFFNTGNLSFYTNINLGVDLFSNYSYLILGDIISYFSIMFREDMMFRFYEISIFIRLFFVGISFIIYSKYKNNNDLSSIFGSIIYVVFSYIVSMYLSNPYILNVLFFIPLVVLGIEKIVNLNKKVYFVFILFLAFISNYYIFSFIYLIILFYGFILVFNKYFDYGIKLVITEFIKVLFYSGIGILLGSFIIIPSIGSNFDYFNSLIDYRYILCSGSLLLLFVLSIKYFKYYLDYLIWLLFIMIIIIIINGINRDILYLLISFVLSFIGSKCINDHLNLRKSDFKWIIGFICLLLVGIYFYNNSFINIFLCSLICLFIYIFIILNGALLSKYRVFNICMYIYLIISSLFVLYNINDFKFLNRNLSINYDKDIKYVIDRIKNEDKGLYRIVNYTSDSKIDGYLYDYNSLDKDYYLELLNGDISTRYNISNVLGVKYFVAKDGIYLPSGFSKYFEYNDLIVFKNNNDVSIMSFYDNYISKDEFDSLNYLDKEDSMATYISSDSEKGIKFKSNIRELKFDYVMYDNYLELNIIDKFNGEIYLYVDNEDIKSMNVKFYDIDKDVYSDKDKLINLTSYKKDYGSIKIYSSNLDKFRYDDIHIYEKSLNKDNISLLNRFNFELNKYRYDYISGSIKVEKDGFIQISNNYMDGYKIYIDGKKTDVIKSNDLFIGFNIEKGSHDILIKYNRPYSIIGIVISVIDLLVIIFISIKGDFIHEKRY